jgi:hypothetical protein
VGRAVPSWEALDFKWGFSVWALGASLFANAATCVSVSYFDQSFLFLFLTLGSVGSLATSAFVQPEVEEASLPVMVPEMNNHVQKGNW